MASETKVRLVPAAPAGSTAQGFNARLMGVTLADLIQMKCMSGATECIRISSDSKVGALQFAGGQLTHAATQDLLGDSAVLELLKWKTGACEPSGTSLPQRSAVRRSWQSLLLDAAQAMDESSSRSAVRMPVTADLGVDEPTLVRSQVHSLRMNAQGQVLDSSGTAEDLAAVTAYTVHMAGYIGQRMGLDAFGGCEFRGGDRRTLIIVEGTGEVIALQSDREEDVAESRLLLGL